MLALNALHSPSIYGPTVVLIDCMRQEDRLTVTDRQQDMGTSYNTLRWGGAGLAPEHHLSVR